MKKTTANLSLLILLLTSCISEAPAPPYPATGLTVVNCLLNNTANQTLRLTRSRAEADGLFFDEISEAQISLYEQDTLVDKFKKSGYGEWKLEFTPTIAKTYRLVVEIEGEKAIQAYTTMPLPGSIKAERGEKTDTKNTKFFSQITQSSYSWMFVIHSSLIDYSYYLKYPTLDQDPKKFLLQEIGTDHIKADRFNQDMLPDPGKEEINTTRYRYYVRIPKDQQAKSAPVRFCVQQYVSAPAQFIVFRHVSDEYDRYLKSVFEKKTLYESEDDPIHWFDESAIYNNIENGLGIFGAYVEEAFYFNNTVTTSTIEL